MSQIVIVLAGMSQLGTALASPRAKKFPESYDGDFAAPESAIPQRSMDYSELRMAALNMISGAATKVWLLSEFMSDSEVVSSLFMAQFRKLDVQVVVGLARSADPLSRVSFLMNQKIPTYIRPKNWNPLYESALLTDEQLVWITGSFDPYSARREFRMVIGTDEEKRGFEQGFLSASGQKILPKTRELPNVGRPTTNYAPIYSKSTPSAQDPTTSSGVYNYNRVRQDRNAPSGVTTKLPKQTISQRRQQQERETPPVTEVPGAEGEN